MIKAYLLENYGYNEPIFLNDLSIEGFSDNALRQAVKRLTSSGFLKRYDSGIYYISKQGGLLGTSYLDPYIVIMRKYVKNNISTYGYITGMSFANQLGITTQMPAVIDIVTNKEATNGRTISVGNQKVRIKKPVTTISKDNAELLQLLDSIGQAEQYTELSMEETIGTLTAYIKQKKFTKEQLSEVASVLTGATAKKMIEWGMIYEFTS